MIVQPSHSYLVVVDLLLAGISGISLLMILHMISTSFSHLYELQFVTQLIDMGYHTDDDRYYEKPNCTPIELDIVLDDPDDTILSPQVDPDFDVNCLVTDGTILTNWADQFISVEDIMDSIQSKVAKTLHLRREDGARAVSCGGSAGHRPATLQGLYFTPSLDII